MPNPTPSDLLEVAANGAMPEYCYHDHRCWYQMFGDVAFGDLEEQTIIDLACIGMVRWVLHHGESPGWFVPGDVDFHSLLTLCRSIKGWRTDAGGGS